MIKKKESLFELQKQVDEWINRYGGGYWNPLSMFSALIEEAGELARELNCQQGNKPKKSEKENVRIDEETGDLLFALICIANYFEIDLEQQLKKSLRKFAQRDKNRYKKTR
ncbi:MAG: nucleotide pyrophosphohydrolase [Promethearchaeota archaeon]|nr:MAG: nucleotide pyrophosphohydrolase [Candidatus Lokiarchaeota archaeon]